MKKIVLLALGILLLFSCASAYQVFIYAPDSLTIGKPLVVNGTTTFGIGTPIDVVLYRQVTTSTEVKRKIAYVQSDKTFRVVFDTTHLEKGTYKVEVPASSTGESVSMRQVQLIDRFDELTLTSQTNQPLSGKMYIAGKISGNSNSGVQIEVIAPDNSLVYGPMYVNTDFSGGFDIIVPISKPGEYLVSFTDEKGYIGAKTINIIGGTVTATVSKSTVPGTSLPLLSAHGRTSRSDPIYFVVEPAGNGPVTISTSSSIDWVIEYVDTTGDLHTINDQNDIMAEEIIIDTDDSKPLYFKIYPYKYSVSSEVYFYAENARAVDISETVPPAFRANSPGMPVPPETQKSAPGTGITIASILTAAFVLFMYRRG